MQIGDNLKVEVWNTLTAIEPGPVRSPLWRAIPTVVGLSELRSLLRRSRGMFQIKESRYAVRKRMN